MKKLIEVLSKQVLGQIRPGKTNIVRIESFDNPVVYSSICKNVSSKVDCFIAKLTAEKFNEFSHANKAEWTQALMYLHQGTNAAYSETVDDYYLNNSFVDFSNAITKWRNESANIDASLTALILLMGTEAATDVGGLSDTSYTISPKEIIASLSNDYSSWFLPVLNSNAIDTEECRKAIHTLYRTLFSSININLFKLSSFVDELDGVYFASAQELIAYICETLNRVWGVPSIIGARQVPKVQSLCKEKLSSAKVLTSAVRFIDRADDIPSDRKIETYKKQFEEYAKKNGIDVNAPFPSTNSLYTSFYSFQTSVIDFLRGINIDENRKKLLNIDYAIIADILGTKLEKTSVVNVKTAPISGEPVEAFSRIFLDAADLFFEEKKLYPNSFSVTVDRIVLSNCVEDQKVEAFMPIASFLGGILDYFDHSSIEYNGELISFAYDNDYGVDPFNFANYHIIEDKIKCTGKWGDPCKVIFIVTLSNGSISKKLEYKWVFSPYSAWPNAFQYLGNVLFRDGEDSYVIPSLVSCENAQDYLSCESEDEFYAQLIQIRDRPLFTDHRKEIHRYFSGTDISGQFDVVCNNFKDFALQLTQHGLFNALNELRALVKSYTSLMDKIASEYHGLTDVQREKVPLLLNCFTITSNSNVLSNCDFGEVIVPAYNPVMLEKVDAKQWFVREGFSELMKGKLSGHPAKDESAQITTFAQLSTITQGLDSVYKKVAEFITCKQMWEYFGVYYSGQTDGELLSGNSFGLSIVTDDEDASAMLRVTPMSNIIVRNIMDYIRTFPARVDGLNVTFIAPNDIQHIVSAIHSVAKNLDEADSAATINVKLICLNSKKNSATYLRKWLDSYFNEERRVKVNTYLRNISVREPSDVEEIGRLLNNCDLCFTYNVLTAVNVQFASGDDSEIDKDQAKFPMTFTPDTIAATSGKARKVNISQFQFIASKYHTQATHASGFPDSVAGVYRTFRTLELDEMHEQIIEMAHDSCKWVVCIDQAIDRKMLEKHDSKIIGFTTGEGSYGELNVTVSARKDLLKDIKLMLKKRITEKFTNWDADRLQKAADYCVDELSSYMDGSRILKALNPYDYEIHNYLAYILSLQMLRLSQPNDAMAVRSLISLDSYKHWFNDDNDNIRPDFMLLEIPKSAHNLDPNTSLQINIKVIECKMGYRNDAHISKARSQLEKGLRTMTGKWNSSDSGIMHRYWLNQLYRAIIFSPLNLSNTSAEYSVIRNKIYGILAGKIDLRWSGDIFAFWLDSNSESTDEYVINSDVVDGLISEGFQVEPLRTHNCGQMYIQKMLLPPEERTKVFAYNDIVVDENTAAEDNSGEVMASSDDLVSTANTASGETIPKQAQVIVPFLSYLSGVIETNRQASLQWFSNYFDVSQADRKLVYESNGHLQWETVLDAIITLFRKDGLIENSAIGSFHLTETGKAVLSMLSGNPAVKYAEAVSRVMEVASKQLHQNATSSQEEKAKELAGRDENGSTSQSSDCTRLSPKQLKDVRLLLGKDLRTNEPYFWEFGNKELNNRHLLINGNSGCGKTYCIQTLLMESALQGISSVVFDYTGGFANSKLDPLFKNKLGEKIVQRIVKAKKIPVNPFVKHDIQIDDDIFVPEENADVADKIAEIFKSVYSLGDQQRSAVYSAVLNGLKIHDNHMSFPAMVTELENIGSNYAKTVISKIQTFIDYDPFTADESFSWADIRDSKGTVYVFQLAGYGREIQVLLTELLLWDIWSFCVKNGDETKPFVLVLDEAQNLSHGEKSPSAKILTEGRKFGLSGWYATQFMKPQLSDDEIQRLQQAGQKLYFCPPDDGIMTVAKNIDISAQGAKEWSEKLKKLKKGECVTCGSMVRNGRWGKYEPRMIKVTSLQERLDDN